jgi:hypothetical protein
LLGVLPALPPKVLWRSKAPKLAPVKTVLFSITNEVVDPQAINLSRVILMRVLRPFKIMCVAIIV